MKVLEGAVAAPNAKIAVVIARFNSFINESLLEGAVDALKRLSLIHIFCNRRLGGRMKMSSG